MSWDSDEQQIYLMCLDNTCNSPPAQTLFKQQLYIIITTIWTDLRVCSFYQPISITSDRRLISSSALRFLLFPFIWLRRLPANKKAIYFHPDIKKKWSLLSPSPTPNPPPLFFWVSFTLPRAMSSRTNENQNGVSARDFWRSVVCSEIDGASQALSCSRLQERRTEALAIRK